jgi:hypothetical protein
VEVFACILVPDYGCLALVGDADGFYGGEIVALGFEFFAGFVDTLGYGGDEFGGVVLVPAG